MLVNAKEILNKALDEKYSICQFNINNLEWTKFILEECELNRAPVILGVSVGAIKYMGGYHTVFNIVDALIKDLKITIPVVLHLDHGTTFEVCKDAIDAGFTSVMIDGSKYSFEDNVKLTKKVVDYAQKYDTSVEAELGHIGGEEDGIIADILYAEVDDCVELVNQTNIDFLAPALGSVHGIYKGKPNLNFERMLEIKEQTKIPLVLHGGSGISDELIKKAIYNGITKININTDLQIVWAEAVREFLNNNSEVYDPRKVIKSGEDALRKCVKEKLVLSGCINN